MLGLQPHTHQRAFLCLDPLKQCVIRTCVLYLAVHLSHLSGKLDLCGVRELRVKGGGSSFHQQLRSIIHLGDEEDDTASGPWTADLRLNVYLTGTMPLSIVSKQSMKVMSCKELKDYVTAQLPCLAFYMYNQCN